MSEKEFFPPDELKLFFDKLLDIKQYVKEAASNSKDKVLHEIYERLDAIIKEKK